MPLVALAKAVEDRPGTVLEEGSYGVDGGCGEGGPFRGDGGARDVPGECG